MRVARSMVREAPGQVGPLRPWKNFAFNSERESRALEGSKQQNNTI
jgi:hypothetical protein